jgi:hypothetical protein
MGGIVKMITGKSGTKGAKRQAAATLKAAADEAKNDRLVAQGAQQTQEAMMAQRKAAQDASELLSAPQDQIDVQLAPDTPDAEIDRKTGRRRTPRSSFMSSGAAGSGIRI